MKRARELLAALFLLAAGCASVPVIIQVAGYAVSAMEIAIQAVDNFARTNVTDQATLTKVENDIAEARAAVAAFQTLVNGGAALDSHDVTEALADFAVAWNDVEALLKSLGVMTAAPSARAGTGELTGRLILPSAASLMPRGVDLVGITARAAAKLAARAQVRRSLDPRDGFIGLANR